MQPFTIAISVDQLTDLRRQQTTRYPDAIEQCGWEYGTDTSFLRRFVAHWADHFDWRAAEQRLNVYSQQPRPADPPPEEEAYFQQVDYWGFAEGD